jgi:hypothetical protein
MGDVLQQFHSRLGMLGTIISQKNVHSPGGRHGDLLSCIERFFALLL